MYNPNTPKYTFIYNPLTQILKTTVNHLPGGSSGHHAKLSHAPDRYCHINHLQSNALMYIA